MIDDDKLLTAIKKRDAECGDVIPDHWQAQLDRRNLLRLLDDALKEIADWNNLY